MSYQNKVFVFDDIISKDYQEKIKELLLSDNFPWFYKSDISAQYNKYQKRPGFSHYFLINNSENFNPYHKILIPIIQASCDKINYKYKNILQGRSFLQLPLNLKDVSSVDTPHIDMLIQHLVVLYYVIDNEAETIIYDNKFESYEKLNNIKNLKEKQRIKPKQGRVVLFDGSFLHTACQPENDIRCVVNYNIQ